MKMRHDLEDLRRRVDAIAAHRGGKSVERRALPGSDEDFEAWFDRDPVWALVWLASQIEEDAGRAWLIDWIETYLQVLCCVWLAALELHRSGVPVAEIPVRMVADYWPPRCWATILYPDQPGPIEWNAGEAERLLLHTVEGIPNASLSEAVPAVDAAIGKSLAPESVIEAFDFGCFVDACAHMHETDPYIRKLDAAGLRWHRSRIYTHKPRRRTEADVTS